MPVTAGTGLLAIAATGVWWLGHDATPLFVDPRAFGTQPWRLLTSSLLHADLLHLGFNLYWLWVLGSVVEGVWGSLRTLGVYVLTSASSSAAEYALFVGGVGLSGVGYGLVALVWVMGRHDPRFRGVVTRPRLTLFAGWFLFCIATTISGVMAVGNVAHAVGAVVGALVALVATSRWQTRWRWGAATAALLFAIAAGATLLRPRINMGAGGSAPASVGYQALERGDAEEALEWYREAVEYGEDARSVYNMGVALQRLERNDEALERYERAHALAPDDEAYGRAVAQASARLGYVALGEGRDRDAVRLYERALHFVADESSYWHNYGVALGGLGHYEDAERAFEIARRLQGAAADGSSPAP